MGNGLFITFEGIDGCGKTTQLNLLADWLSKKGFKVLITKEPGSIGLGEKLREILLNYDGEVSPKCESFLFLADRAQHIDTIVMPAIEQGMIVLCDRHIDSTIAYQGYGRGIDIEYLKNLNSIATSNFLPDLTFIFDVDVETSQNRVGKNKDRLEKAGYNFFTKVRKGYVKIAKLEPQRIKLIDGSENIEDIQKKVMDIINDKL